MERASLIVPNVVVFPSGRRQGAAIDHSSSLRELTETVFAAAHSLRVFRRGTEFYGYNGWFLTTRSSRDELPQGTQRRTVAGLAGESRPNIKHVVPHPMIEAPRFSVADLFGTEHSWQKRHCFALITFFITPGFLARR